MRYGISPSHRAALRGARDRVTHLGRLIAATSLAAVLAACGGGSPAAPVLAPTTTTGQEAAIPKQYSAPPVMSIDPAKGYRAVLHTSEGDMALDLLPEEAPLAVNSFVFLAREGYYDGVRFHRIIQGFMVQSGDPTGTGRGGPGYTFRDEPVARGYLRGTLAMANAGPNTNGSQFFIVHRDSPLPPRYTIFGVLSEGLDTLDRIASTPVTASPSGEVSAPVEPVVIERVEILEVDR